VKEKLKETENKFNEFKEVTNKNETNYVNKISELEEKEKDSRIKEQELANIIGELRAEAAVSLEEQIKTKNETDLKISKFLEQMKTKEN